MGYLICGMIISGILARVTLLSVRGNFFHQDQAQKSNVTVLIELFGVIAGLTAFVLSFLLFSWWLPLVCLALGYWIVAPILVGADSWAFYQSLRPLLTLGSIGCSIMLIDMQFSIFNF